MAGVENLNYFYHSDIGVWATTSEPSDKVRSMHPVGTIEIPAPSSLGMVWNAKHGVEEREVPLLDDDGDPVIDENGDAVIQTVIVDVGAWEDAPYVDPVIEWRKKASLDRGSFVLACVAAGILPATEAVSAAKGDWPSTFAAIFDSMDEMQSLAAQIEWASAASIRRSHPLIVALGAMAQLTDDQVDALFGWGSQ